MLFDTSYSDMKVTRQINDAVGSPYSFIQRLKMGGIGSRRMVIKDIDEEYRKHLKADIYRTYANIELRPVGLLVHLRDKLQTLTWAMPLKGLSIRYDHSLVLTSHGKFIEFDEQELDRTFINRLLMKLG